MKASLYTEWLVYYHDDKGVQKLKFANEEDAKQKYEDLVGKNAKILYHYG